MAWPDWCGACIDAGRCPAGLAVDLPARLGLDEVLGDAMDDLTLTYEDFGPASEGSR
jgi:hypothetical protein